MSGILQTFIRDNTRTCAVALLIPTLTGCVADLHRIFELTCHFRVQYFVIAAVFAGVLLLVRDWRWAGVALLSAAINGAAIAPWYFSPKPDKPLAPALPLRLLLSNVHTANLRSAPLLALIQREQPDLVILEEVNDRWMADLDVLRKDYPYSKWIPRSDNFGIAVLSRRELADPREIDFDSEVPTILTDFLVGSQCRRGARKRLN
jgi:endonuclease/exonuclease/phosphatase (EEP) superfamily protein YafD